MITPKFSVSQDDEFVIVTMYVKYIKASDCDFYIMDKEFKFYCRPYFLRLTFPHELLEDGREKAAYDVERGELRVHLPKLNNGQYFENLDLVAQLMGTVSLSQAEEKQTKPLIEVVSGGNELAEDEASRMELDEDEELDWSFPQQPNQEEEPLPGSQLYGFNNSTTGFFSHVQEDLSDIVDNPAPDQLSPAQRRELRVLHENDHFNEDHYVADFMEDDEIQEIIKFETKWDKELRHRAELRALETSALSDDAAKISENKTEEASVPFSPEHLEMLLNLPLKEYLIADERPLLLALIDLMFAYCYNHRTTMGDDTVESCWTIAKLSSTLSWFDTFSSPHEVLVACVRRSLCFPLYRHASVAMSIVADTKKIFRLGKRAVLRALLDIKRLFADSDHQHYFNRLYIDDFCIWTQTLPRKVFRKLADDLEHVEVKRSDIEWPLDELEEWALNAPVGEEGEDAADVDVSANEMQP